MLAAALAAGLRRRGADVRRSRRAADARRGLPRPARRRARRRSSRRRTTRWTDNGIKLLAAGGRKLTRRREEAIEASAPTTRHRDGRAPSRAPSAGRRQRARPVDARRPAYAAHLVAVPRGSPPRRAAGRARLRQRRGARVVGPERAAGARRGRRRCSHAEPDGTNINAGCGSTHPARAAGGGRRGRRRCRAGASTATPTGSSPSTHTGALVDGDHIIAICAIDLQQRGHARAATRWW